MKQTIIKKIKWLKQIIIKTIIWLSNCVCDYAWEEIERTPSLLEKRTKKYIFLKYYFRRLHFEWFWDRIIKEISVRDFSDFTCFFDSVNENTKFVVSKLLYYSQKYDNERCEQILRFAEETSNVDYRYWITQEISRFTFHLQKGFYPDYYNDRRQLLKQICEDMQLTVPLKKEERTNKLCIITSMLDKSIKNSTQRVAAMFAKGLVSDFDEICIFSLDIFAPVGQEKRKLNTVLPYKPSILSKQGVEAMLPAGVKVHYPKGNCYAEKMQDVLNGIYEYNPCVILDMSDEYSAISYHYANDFCTVYLPLRRSNSSSCFTYMLESRWKIEASYENDRHAGTVKNIEWSFPEYIPPMNGKKSKSDLNYSEQDFVVVCAGNNDTVCNEEFVDEMAKLLTNNPRIKLLFVGKGAPSFFIEKYPLLFKNGQVREWGFENDLFGLYCACDVLVRPNMTGGSGATAIAAMADLPIAMTDFICDPNRWLGLDFSPFHTYSQVMDYILRLSEDGELYCSSVKKCKDLVNKAIDSPEKWKKLGYLLKMPGE